MSQEQSSQHNQISVRFIVPSFRNFVSVHRCSPKIDLKFLGTVLRPVAQGIVLLIALFSTSSSRGQIIGTEDSLLHPYLGGSAYLSIGPPLGGGGGIEGGVSIHSFYTGVEFGYSIFKVPVHTDNEASYSSAPFNDQVASLFYGVHVGVLIVKELGMGLLLTGGSQMFDQTTFSGPFGGNVITKHNSKGTVSLGPDLRLHPGRHTQIDFAYTYNAGFKLGIDYVM